MVDCIESGPIWTCLAKLRSAVVIRCCIWTVVEAVSIADVILPQIKACWTDGSIIGILRLKRDWSGDCS